jgi:hypothetical protein
VPIIEPSAFGLFGEDPQAARERTGISNSDLNIRYLALRYAITEVAKYSVKLCPE